MLSCPGGTRTPAAPGDRALEGERNWERWKPREEGGVREGSEGDAMFRKSHRYGYSGVYFGRDYKVPSKTSGKNSLGAYDMPV